MHKPRENPATVEAQDNYELLGVDRDVDGPGLHTAYIRLSWVLHPGRNGGSTLRFIEMKAAYDTLRNPLDRAAYDRNNPPKKKSSTATETASGSAQGESASGTTETASGSAHADGNSDSGSRSSSSTSTSGGDPAPSPKAEPKNTHKPNENSESRHYGPKYSRRYHRVRRPTIVWPEKYAELRAMHVANDYNKGHRPDYRARLNTFTLETSRPAFRPQRHRLREFSLG